MKSLDCAPWLSSIGQFSWRHGMPTSTVRVDATAVDVAVTDDRILVVFADGRELAAPLVWFPRLADASPDQCRNWRLIGRGHGIHWPEIDEDIFRGKLVAGELTHGCVPEGGAGYANALPQGARAPQRRGAS
jgi:Protein of unknown function (DUF2442)